MTAGAPERAGSRLSRDARWYPIVAIVPYVILALLAGYTIIDEPQGGVSLAVDLALCALAAVWMLWMFTLHPAWQSRPGIMGVFVAGLIVIMAVLVVREPWFGVFAIAGYIYVFALIPWPWQLFGVAGVAVVAGIAQAWGIPKDTPLGLVTTVIIIAVNILAISIFAWIYWSSTELSAERSRALDEVSAANRRLEATLAENAALQEQLMEQARQAGTLDERQRMAREIHDTLAQGLIGIITQLQAAEQSSDDPADRQHHFEAAIGLARESLSEARRSVSALRPEVLEEARLGEALRDVAARWSALNGIPVTVATTGNPQHAPADAEDALLRTAQEALANVARHAHATRVWLTLSYLEDDVALDVRDDGDGFDPAARGVHAPATPGDDTTGGFGLVAMRERIERLTGTLQVESEPGTGTAVSASIPLHARGVVA